MSEATATAPAPPGPLAAIYRFRELILILVQRDLKVRYKRSVLGMLWTLLNPLLQMAVYTFVFSTVMKVGQPAFALFLLTGLLPWILLSTSATSAAFALLNNQALIRKVAVPQAVYPLAVVGSKLVDTVLSLLPLAGIAIFFGRAPWAGWLALVPLLALATCFSVGMALLFSSLTVFFRDMRHLIDILFQVWFYVTPVLYPAEYLQRLPYPWLRPVLWVNPATPLVRCFQAVVYDRALPDPVVLGAAVAWALVTLAVGFALFLKVEDRHIHYF